mgnify:CR=1 FL=1
MKYSVMPESLVNIILSIVEPIYESRIKKPGRPLRYLSEQSIMHCIILREQAVGRSRGYSLPDCYPNESSLRYHFTKWCQCGIFGKVWEISL